MPIIFNIICPKIKNFLQKKQHSDSNPCAYLLMQKLTFQMVNLNSKSHYLVTTWLQNPTSGGWYPIWFNSMFEFGKKKMINSILFYPSLIQNIIQFKKKSADSIQKTIQFNSQGIINTGWLAKVPKKCSKSVQNRQKGGFSSKMANIDSKFDSFIHFTKRFNSKDYSISIFQEYSIQKIIQYPFFPRKFNSKIDSRILIWLDSIQ